VVIGVAGVVPAAGGSTPGPDAVGADLLSGAPVPLGVQRGTVTVTVKLVDPSLAAANAQGSWSKGQQQQYVKDLENKQDAVRNQVENLGGRQVARLTKALDALVVSVDRSKIRQIEALPNVRSVRIVRNYGVDLSETVPYIGASALQAIGKDGTGVRIAVLDSGIDYTHKDLGGPGTAAAYEAAYGTSTTDPRTTSTDGLFPTSKVVGGYDFVGEAWSPDGPPLAPDPDPIDCGPQAIPAPCAGGHGTHVADIIAGVGPAKGVAPGAKLYAYKVCSAVSNQCSGVALLRAVDAALDPNGDGSIADHVDVLNLSLGSSYGQDEDDLSAALNNAVKAGLSVVASAGNSSNRPYIVGSPSSAENVISVAQTHVPSSMGYALQINAPPAIAGLYRNTAAVDWAPVGSGFTGDVAYVGRGCPGDAYRSNPSGKVALIDRGSCGVSLKVDRAAKAGAVGVLIGLVAPGDPFAFGFGGGDTFVPTLVITKADADRIKANIGAPVNVTVGPSTAVPLVKSMVGSSSRGPSYSRSSIKPDIGAPGASVSAEAGTGTGTIAFGGTSGAAPMVSGAVALLRGAFPGRSPFEVKALLMNTAETDIQTNPLIAPGVLAPITRIGGGEVRVKAAYDSTTAAWDEKDKAGSLSFGYVALAKPKKLRRTVVVRNYSGSPVTYSVTPTFRYGDDQASGAVSFSAPSSITVPANGQRSFSVDLTIDPAKLPLWALNGGARGGDGSALNLPEYDGYLNLDGGTNSKVHLAWQVLPHRAADVFNSNGENLDQKNDGSGTLELRNKSSVLDGQVEVFSLTGNSRRIAKRFLPSPGDNFAVIDLQSVGVRSTGDAVQFAVDTYGMRAHPNYPGEFDFYVDSNRDGQPDYIVFNAENGGFAASGQNLTWVYDVANDATSAYYFTDADLNSGNAILTAPAAAIGLAPGQKFDFSVYAFDNYFTGNQTDAIENMTYTLGQPQFAVAGPQSFAVPAGGSTTLSFAPVPGGAAASPSNTGIQLLYRDAEASGRSDPSQKEAEAIVLKQNN
jgi:subtilisin family serine protease